MALFTQAEAEKIYYLPFNDLLFHAHSIHRENFDANQMQMSRLISIKTGGCPEDCGYCSQSVHSNIRMKATKLMDVQAVIEDAKTAKAQGASRVCMGAAWRSPKERDMPLLIEMIKQVKALGVETCMTLGTLTREQAEILQTAGLDYYNHNIDTSEDYYPSIISTHTFNDRLTTLQHVRDAGMKVCCGGILGMGESEIDRIKMLVTLANLDIPPESVTLNKLIPIAGTKVAHVNEIGSIEFIRVIALARILIPTAWIRLSAGRTTMDDVMQALCFFAGANSIFTGDKLLTADNPNQTHDNALLERLGMAC